MMLKSRVSEMRSETMKRRVSLVLLAAVLSLAGGCSSESDGGSTGRGGTTGPGGTTDPTTLCNELATAICSKFYGCYTAEQLVAMSKVAGQDEAGCITKWATDLGCATDPTDCKAGQTYNSAKAQECVNDYQGLTCAGFMGFLMGTTPEPAACNEACK
jgi:hypothetical protein